MSPCRNNVGPLEQMVLSANSSLTRNHINHWLTVKVHTNFFLHQKVVVIVIVCLQKFRDFQYHCNVGDCLKFVYRM